jgi:thiaminase
MSNQPIQILRDYVNNELKQVSKNVQAFPWNSADAYAAWLAQTYYYVSHSTRLLALSAALFPLNANQLHRRFLQHTREESAHEVLAERDLKALGYSLKDFPEFPETAAFYQTQYYQIEHVDPISFFGYILFLEGLATQVASWATKEIERIYGEKTATFLKVHGEEDDDHIEKAFENLKNLTEEQLQLIRKSFEISSALYQASLSRAAQQAVKGSTTNPGRKAA